MKTFKQLLEAKSGTIVLAFGRLNPVSSGHAVLANAVIALAKKNNADHVFYVSRSQDAKKNPLTADQKVYYARQSFKGLNVVAASDQVRTFIEAAKSLTGKYDHLIMVAGSDRVLEFKTLLDRYNGKDFSFKTIHVVSAGERDPDAEGATGMSATKLRQAAADNDFAKFKSGVPTTMSQTVAKKMFDDVRAGMKLHESSSDVREDYINDRVFNVGDIVMYKNEAQAIIYRGANHVVLENKTNAWLRDITPTGEVMEEVAAKHQDKIKAARIIGMSLGYMDAESKSDPSQIVNSALRGIRKKALNPESKKIIKRMLTLADQMGIVYDRKLIDIEEACAVEPPLDDEEKSAHNLLHKPGRAHGSNYERVRKIHLKVHEGEESEDDEDDFDEDDIDDHLAGISDDDIINCGYEDDEFHIVDDETDEIQEDFDTSALNEVLSRTERLRAKVRMARSASKRERGMKIALSRRSTSDVLAHRARRVAVKTLELKLAKKPLAQLSIGEKERLEARIARLKPAITRMALKMLPRVRSVERTRLEHRTTQK